MNLEKTIDHLSIVFISKNFPCFNKDALKSINKNLNKSVRMKLSYESKQEIGTRG